MYNYIILYNLYISADAELFYADFFLCLFFSEFSFMRSSPRVVRFVAVVNFLSFLLCTSDNSDFFGASDFKIEDEFSSSTFGSCLEYGSSEMARFKMRFLGIRGILNVDSI